MFLVALLIKIPKKANSGKLFFSEFMYSSEDFKDNAN